MTIDTARRAFVLQRVERLMLPVDNEERKDGEGEEDSPTAAAIAPK